jgi:diadenosine tetraphosphate (Ap4A) HIT family hydrolase
MSCPFCAIRDDRIVARNASGFVVRDQYPVSPGHMLIILGRHAASWFDATVEEQLGLLELLRAEKLRLDSERSPAGYNIGVNVGHAAGQTIDHLHVHLIPRYEGDVDDPTGGVRGVIPGMSRYGD